MRSEEFRAFTCVQEERAPVRTDSPEAWAENIMSGLTDTIIRAMQEQGWALPRRMDHRLIYHRRRIRIRVDSYIVPEDHWDKTGSIKKRARWGIYNFMCRLLRM